MALTRKLLKGMGLTEEQVDTIIEAHTDTVDGLKEQIKTYKADADKLPSVQKELDTLKAAGDDGYQKKYEDEHKAFEDYKADIVAKDAKAAKEKAVRAYFESKNITGANLELAMRGCGEEMAAIELDGDKIKDSKALDALVEGTYKSLVSTTTIKGANTPTPPNNNGGKVMTKDEIMQIKDRAERRAAIASNPELFGLKGE
jgi:NACalpha-BTF3-like transcription factor